MPIPDEQVEETRQPEDFKPRRRPGPDPDEFERFRDKCDEVGVDYRALGARLQLEAARDLAMAKRQGALMEGLVRQAFPSLFRQDKERNQR